MAHTIATVIMVEGELDLKQLAQGCTYAPGKIPAEDPRSGFILGVRPGGDAAGEAGDGVGALAADLALTRRPLLRLTVPVFRSRLWLQRLKSAVADQR